MDNSIIFITKSWHHYTAAQEILQRHRIELPVFFASDVIDAVKIAGVQIENGAKVLISTDYLCTLFMEKFDVPIVPIKRSSHSFCMRIMEAREKGHRVALLARVGSSSFTQAAQEAQSLFDKDVALYYFKQNDKTLAATQRIKADGFTAIIGPSWIHEAAIQAGLEFLSVPLPESPFLDAIALARYNLRIYQERMEKEQLISAILDSANEAMIALDSRGTIININRTARQLFDVATDEVIQQPYEKTPLSCLELHNSLTLGQPINSSMATFRSRSFIYSTIPLPGGQDGHSLIVKCTAIEQLQEAEHNLRMKLLPRGSTPTKFFHNIVGQSAAITQSIEIAKRYATVDSTVLISAPSGCGKEVFAQSIHNASSRKGMPFVVINCAAMPESILESILFGYEPGSFTGARSGGKAGLFELAHKGTVFLDEVSEMPLAMQGRFLRVLQEREVMRIGSDRPVPIDIRVIAATNRNLLKMVQDGAFREDLYYRLGVLLLKIPPLSQRQDDIPALTRYFLTTRSMELHCTPYDISPNALNLLCHQHYSGNVRQLNNILERAMVLSPTHMIDLATVRLAFDNAADPSVPSNTSPEHPLRSLRSQQEADEIRAALSAASGNRAKAAAMLGISTTTLWRKMRALQIQ